MYYGFNTAGSPRWVYMPIADVSPQGIIANGDLVGNERDVVHVSATPSIDPAFPTYCWQDRILWEFKCEINHAHIIANKGTQWERTMDVWVEDGILKYEASTGIHGEGPVGSTYIPSAGWCTTKYDRTPCSVEFPEIWHYWEDACALPFGNEYALYIDAVDSVSLSSNNIANIKDILDLIKAIVSGNAFKALKELGGFSEDLLLKASNKEIKALCKGSLSSAGDVWLKYRYCYNTTKSDITDFKEKFQSITNETIVGRSSGTVATKFGVGDVHCKVAFRQKTCNSVLEFWRSLKRYGLCPDARNIWDLIPFSFIADWFFDIGDKAELLSNEWKTSNLYMDLLGGCYSCKVSFDINTPNGGVSVVTLYKRRAMRRFPAVDLNLEKSQPSTKTSVKRVIDGVSMLIS